MAGDTKAGGMSFVKTKTLKERFLEKCEAIPIAGCWLWMGQVRPNGYGYIVETNNQQQRKVSAHRLAYEMFVGEIPTGVIVCHRCDVRCCVNPDHLFAGSVLDNINDKLKKGRQPRGVEINTAKITPKQAVEIFESTEETAALMARYGVGRCAVRYIKRGMSWGHVTGANRVA